MLSKNDCREAIKKLMSYTENYAVAVIADNGTRLTRFANSEIHQNVEIDDAVIKLTVYKGKKEATCVTNAFDDESLKALAAQADGILDNMPDGEFEIIPAPGADVPESPSDPRLAQVYDIKGRAEAVKRNVDRIDKDFTVSGLLSLDRYMRAYGNKDGVFRHYDFDTLTCEVVATHKDGATGFAASMANKLEDCDIDRAFTKALSKAKMAVNPVFAELGAYTVILEPEAVADLMGYALYDLNAENIQDGTSYAAGKLGEKFFGDNIFVEDDVNNPGTYQRFFDVEGHPRKSIKLIDGGKVVNFLYCSKTAQRDGVQSTGHAISSGGNGGYPFNIVMRGGDSSVEEMIAGTKKGLLITRFNYTNTVNPKTLQITGLTRDGTFMIKDGKIAYPVANMRFTEFLTAAFSNVAALSREVVKAGTWGGVGLFPAVKIENFHFTGGQK
ncbi:MAG: TldD/PmbA family protein [Clostridiales bacterium]|jgi:predicted Zn-dependent protease|nr:TldD/PmbA family protein [Clostridiales bacterium]